MATYVWCELVCDQCARAAPEGQFVAGDRIPRKALKDSAKRAGWVFDSENRAFCCEAHKNGFSDHSST